MRIINHNLSLTYPSIGTSPHELGLPVKTNRQPGNFTGLGPDIHLISHHFTFNGGSLGITSMTLVQREPILRHINFQLKPYPYLGIVGVLKNWKGIASEPNHQFLSIHQVILVIFTFKKIQWNDSSFQGFSKSFDSHVPI